jgi:hypothetical protein
LFCLLFILPLFLFFSISLLTSIFTSLFLFVLSTSFSDLISLFLYPSVVFPMFCCFTSVSFSVHISPFLPPTPSFSLCRTTILRYLHQTRDEPRTVQLCPISSHLPLPVVIDEYCSKIRLRGLNPGPCQWECSSHRVDVPQQ